VCVWRGGGWGVELWKGTGDQCVYGGGGRGEGGGIGRVRGISVWGTIDTTHQKHLALGVLHRDIRIPINLLLKHAIQAIRTFPTRP
jgi:hypothetical protein